MPGSILAAKLQHPRTGSENVTEYKTFPTDGCSYDCMAGNYKTKSQNKWRIGVLKHTHGWGYYDFWLSRTLCAWCLKYRKWCEWMHKNCKMHCLDVNHLCYAPGNIVCDILPSWNAFEITHLEQITYPENHSTKMPWYEYGNSQDKSVSVPIVYYNMVQI